MLSQPSHATEDIATQITIELGAGAVFITAHPQLRLGLLGPTWSWGQPEIQALYALGTNNFNHLSHTVGLQGRFLFNQLPWLSQWEQAPYLRLGTQTSLTSEAENRSPLSGTFGLGLEGRLYGPLRYSGGVELLIPDVYSRSPFVLRPELNLRWVF